MVSRSSSSAKRRAGTRMSERVSAGISHSVSSIRRSSDIEHQPCFPARRRGAEDEPMVGHRLHERAWHALVTGDACALAAEIKLVERFGDETGSVGKEDDLLQQLHELGRTVVSAELDFPRLAVRCFISEQLREGRNRFGEDFLLTRAFDRELELGGVLDPAVHQRSRPSAAAPSVVPIAFNSTGVKTFRLRAWRLAIQSSSRSSSEGSMLTFASEPMQSGIPRSLIASVGRKPSPRSA